MDVVDAGALVPLEAEAITHGSARVERVEFLVDDAVVGIDSEAPYAVTWTAEGLGRHMVRATVHDSLGAVAESDPVTTFVGIRALERSIARLADEAEEHADGWVVLNEPGGRPFDNLILGRGRVVGLRFADIRIPRGTPVQEAYLEFTAAGPPRAAPTEVTLHVEAIGDAVAFRELRQNVSSRTRTAASVAWSLEPWNVAGETHRTPNLAALIQDVVNRPDWHDGNALVLLLSGSGRRDAVSYDGARRRQRLERAPRLYIELAAATP